MKPSPNPVDSLLRLAGRVGFTDHAHAGLSMEAMGDLFSRMASAKPAAGLSTPRFLELNDRPLAEFCLTYDFTHIEIRLGQSIVAHVWASA
jgi:hypothetical protein